MERKPVLQWNRRTGLSAGSPQAAPTEGGAVGHRARLLLLTCLGGGCATLSFVTAFDLPVNGWATLLVLWGLTALFTGLFSLRRAAVPLLLVAVLLWAALGWWLREDIVSGLLKTADLILDLFASHSSFTFVDLGEAVNNLPHSLATRQVSTFLLMALFPWVLIFTWAGVEHSGFVLSFALTLPFVAVPLWFYIQPAPMALMGLFLYWGATAFGRLVPRRDRHLAGQAGLFALPALALVLFLLHLLAPQADYVRPPEMETVRLRAEDFLQRLPGLLTSEEGGGLALPTNGFLSKDQQRRSFDNLGSARFSGYTALRVKVAGDRMSPLYLKGYTGGVYTSGGWERLGDKAEAALAAAAAPIDPQNLSAYSYGGPVESDAVTILNQANKKAIYVPNGLITTPDQFALAEFVGDGNIRAKGLLGLDEYTVKYLAHETGSSVIQSYAPGMELLAQYGQAAYQYYTDVPSELSGILDEVLSRTPSLDISFPTSMKADKVAGILKDLGTYTLTPGSPPAGRDFTEYFLAENQRGFFVHFATAGVLLLRQLGVPARYCEGYLVTPTDLRLKGSDGFSNVSDRRAHAWVEYWRDGVGWVTLECTPGFAPQADLIPPNDATNETDATPQPTKPPEPTPVPTPKPDATPAPEKPAPEKDSAPDAVLWFLKVAVWPLLAVLAVAVRRRIVLYLRQKAFARPDRNSAALAMYLAADQLTPYVGNMDEELTALAQKARFSQHTLSGSELEALAQAWDARQKTALKETTGLKKLWLIWGMCLTRTQEPGP